MPVHLYGQVADMGRLMPIAEQHGLRVLEDAAQAHGSAQHGKSAGSFGIGSFSFYATKNITTGEGGIVTTDDDEFAERLRILRNQGMRARYEYVMHGHNYRMTDLQAALGIPQIGRYNATVERRSENAEYLSRGLADVPGLVTPREQDGRRHVWHQYTVRITEEARLTRDEFIERVTSEGIGAGVYYPKLVFDYDAYRDRDDVVIEPTPVAERVAREAVSLPVHTHLMRDQLDEIIAATRRALGAAPAGAAA
jgi:dTDP-4-amino-4,6-dideoxygalactose transaminase